jgi:(2R)-3-sulfolactate dehydrogenase (NADP+)
VERNAVSSICLAALSAAGASPRVADLLTHAALFAEDCGIPNVGVAHLFDYIDAMRGGRLNGHAVPSLNRPREALITSDARGGIPHMGFDLAFGDLLATARRLGVAVFSQHGAYGGGQLGWFTDRLAAAGLVAFATAVSPALMATGPGSGRVFGTNPLAYSVPRVNQEPITVDQASSATAFVSVRDAAASGEPLPEGWALDAEGRPTTNAQDALTGALLPFGGYKGANIAWLVELLSSMAGGRWSVDAAPFDTGSQCPSVGMFVLAVDHSAVGRNFPARVEQHVDRLADRGVRRPGITVQRMEPPERLELRADVLTALRHRADSSNSRVARPPRER